MVVDNHSAIPCIEHASAKSWPWCGGIKPTKTCFRTWKICFIRACLSKKLKKTLMWWDCAAKNQSTFVSWLDMSMHDAACHCQTNLPMWLICYIAVLRNGQSQPGLTILSVLLIGYICLVSGVATLNICQSSQRVSFAIHSEKSVCCMAHCLVHVAPSCL